MGGATHRACAEAEADAGGIGGERDVHAVQQVPHRIVQVNCHESVQVMLQLRHVPVQPCVAVTIMSVLTANVVSQDCPASITFCCASKGRMPFVQCTESCAA